MATKSASIDPTLYPNLAHSITLGEVWVTVRGEVEGRASDGTTVLLGSVHSKNELRFTEAYLTANPNPSQW